MLVLPTTRLAGLPPDKVSIMVLKTGRFARSTFVRCDIILLTRLSQLPTPVPSSSQTFAPSSSHSQVFTLDGLPAGTQMFAPGDSHLSQGYMVRCMFYLCTHAHICCW
jgi:hypothetical protein